MALVESSSRIPTTLRRPFFQDKFFRDAWDDFDRVHREMQRESDKFWDRVDKKRDKAMVSTSAATSIVKDDSGLGLNTPRRYSSDPLWWPSYYRDPFFFPRRWWWPRYYWSDLDWRDLDLWQYPSDRQVIRLTDNDDKFEISLDTYGFKPHEIKVNVSGNTLSVDARHEEKSDSRFESKEFHRKYTLPDGCPAWRVKSNLSSDGVLMITAPKSPSVTYNGYRSVPIEQKKW